jgi:hypothetical protein
MAQWTKVLELDQSRAITAGSEKGLADAIRRGADLRIGTQFLHGEHIDPESDSDEIIEEVAEFGVTYLIDDHWSAGIINLRQPVSLMPGFGPGSSMSFFMYNQNGEQAVARPYFENSQKGRQREAKLSESSPAMPKYHVLSSVDEGSNAPSQNFIWDFEVFRYWVRDDWREVFSHSADGQTDGSIDALEEAVIGGSEVKVGVSGLCDDLMAPGDRAPQHEVFVRVGSCYHYTKKRRLTTGTHPLVRVRPAVPMRYDSKGWDFGWLVCRSDGFVDRRLYDPYTLTCADSQMQCAMRWFVR